MSETVYKELYEANKKLEFMQNTIMAIADRLSVATGIDIKEASAYGIDLAPHLKVTKVTEPPKRSAGIKVESVGELVAKLKDAGVI